MSILSLVLVGSLIASPAAPPPDAPRAPSEPGKPRPTDLRYDWQIDGAVTALAGGLWIFSEILKPSLAPPGCQWCSRNGFDDAATRALAWGDIRTAARASDLFAFGAVPALTLGSLGWASHRDGRLAELPANTLLLLEAVALSAVVNQAVKYAVARERPFVADLPPAQKARTSSPADNDLSFYSGHSNLAFALAVGSGTLAHLRGYPAEPWVWGIGLPAAALVAYSRVAAKKHYLTDVMVGSLAGAAFGFGVPWLFHGAERPAAVAVLPLPGGAAMALRF